MVITTATMSVPIDPDAELEILENQSGERIYTATNDRTIGNPNSIAIGSPRLSLLRKCEWLSLTCSQCFKNAVSSGVNMCQI